MYPTLNAPSVSRAYTEEFKGLNTNYRVGEGEFSEILNLNNDAYPVLSSVRPPGRILSSSTVQGIFAKDSLFLSDNGQLFYNQLDTGMILSPGEKTFISMGAYLVIFPDRKYINTADISDNGSLDSHFESTDITYDVCKLDGNNYDIAYKGTSAPTEAENGAIWLDTSGEKHILKQYSETQAMWIQIATTYVKITSPGIGQSFNEGDGVKLKGCKYSGDVAGMDKQIEEFNKAHVIKGKGENYIIVIGLLDQSFTQTTKVEVDRKMPEFDYVIESRNRLWACKYGIVDGKTVNEIYASKQGDFKNWNVFDGVSTDSYAVSLGTDGMFTGAATHLGYPIFFKENCLHKIQGTLPSNYQASVTNCRGVAKGCEKSIATVNETLIYKSTKDFCTYDGSLPASISDNLYGLVLNDVSAGAINGKYFASGVDGFNKPRTLVFDSRIGTWTELSANEAFAYYPYENDLLYCNSTGVYSALGTQGTLLEDRHWHFETGIYGFSMPDKKYLSRFNVRMAATGTVKLKIEYDSTGVWEERGEVKGTGITKSFVIPVRPRRCDHMKLRLEGTGEFRLYSIARILEEGADV